METFPNEKNKIRLLHSEQQQNVPLDREQLLRRGNLKDWIAFKENAPRVIKSKSWGLSKSHDSVL